MRISQRLTPVLHSEDDLPSASPFGPVDIRLASSPEEYATAFRIAYQSYFPLGYTAYSPSGMRITPYQFRPTTMIFLAYHEGRAVACLSLFEDGDNGLPSDNGWPEDLERLRTKFKNIFEIGSLMVLPDCQLKGPGLCLALFRHAWLYARSFRESEALCAFVQARHALFYTKLINFKAFGSVKTYRWNHLEIPKVQALSINLNAAEIWFYNRFERFGESPKNLYRHFVIHGHALTRQTLHQQLIAKNALDLQALQRHFTTHIRLSESASTSIEATPAVHLTEAQS